MPGQSDEGTAWGERLHRLIAEVARTLGEIDGVADVEVVDHTADQAFYGFTYDDVDMSLAWNITE